MFALNAKGQRYVLNFVAHHCKTTDPRRACVGDPNYGRGWFDDAVNAACRGDFQFEIGPYYTRTGRPVTCDVDPDCFDVVAQTDE